MTCPQVAPRRRGRPDDRRGQCRPAWFGTRRSGIRRTGRSRSATRR